MSSAYIIKIDSDETKRILNENLPALKDDPSSELISFNRVELNGKGSDFKVQVTLDVKEGVTAAYLCALKNVIENNAKMPASFEINFQDGGATESQIKELWLFFAERAGEARTWILSTRPSFAGDKMELICENEFIAGKLSDFRVQASIRKAIRDFFARDIEIASVKTTAVSADQPAAEPEAASIKITGKRERESKVLVKEEIKGIVKSINSISEAGKYILEGRVFFDPDAEPIRELKNKKGTYIISFYITDDEDTLKCIAFIDENDGLRDTLSALSYVRLSAEVSYDDRDGELSAKVRRINRIKAPERHDGAAEKRVELHAHTKLSAMDSLMALDDYIKTAASWGHTAVAITDHGVVHSFPDAYKRLVDYYEKKHKDLFVKGRTRREGYMDAIEKRGATKLIFGMEGYLVDDREAKDEEHDKPWHIIILAKNYTGLKNLYKIVSASHLEYFYKKPRIPRSLLNANREGLVLGTACYLGELYQAILEQKQEKVIEEIAARYDYFEIQPDTNNMFLLKNGTLASIEDLHRINRRIVELGKKMYKPVAATCDAHFLNKKDRTYREFLMLAMGFEEADAELYLRTTDEMLEAFAYLGPELSKEVVITAPQKIAALIEPALEPVPSKIHPPSLPDADNKIREATWNRAAELYGDDILPEVKERIDRELKSIIGNNYAVLYLIAKVMVERSNMDGYIVGSRGSVGSSIVAFLCGISEVNPLQAHHLCPKCKYMEFIDTELAGVDMDSKKCPHCKTEMGRDGFNIPFETFMGFKGDKVPDIDLNFSGEYQEKIHNFLINMFGKDKVFKAGTINTLQQNAIKKDFMNKYIEKTGANLKNAEKMRLAMGCADVKRGTGQHPGGLMLVPDDKEICDFTPVQFAPDKESITTHFDYHFIHDTLVKIDALGHELPTSLKHICEDLNIKVTDIPIDDKQTMQIFSSLKPLNVNPENYDSQIGTLGVPEFGTGFLRQMLNDTKPKTFSELVYISGLSHGTNVWLGNAQELINKKTATLKEVISTRDDIMEYLIRKGLEKGLAFSIMESVRRGRGLTPEFEKAMKEHKVPEWYIESCKKIKYMFPKAHAVAYTIMSFRIAYIKIHHPEHFYADYLNRDIGGFEYEFMAMDLEAVKKRLRESRFMKDADKKEKDRFKVLEVLVEMKDRGYIFSKVDLYKSHPTRFTVKDGKILPPLIAVPGLGEKVAVSVSIERNKSQFTSVEDLVKRTKVNKSVVEFMKLNNLAGSLPDSDQAVLF